MDPVFRIGGVSPTDPRALEALFQAIVTGVENGPSAVQKGAQENPCDSDPACVLIGEALVNGVVYYMYECNGTLVGYPAP